MSKAVAVIHTGTVHLSLLCPARSKDRNSRRSDIKHFQNTADSKWIVLHDASSMRHLTCLAYGSHSVIWNGERKMMCEDTHIELYMLIGLSF